ncbi:NIL domain-containing protein, partial [Staphylococcus haemolyticus]
RLNFNGNNTTEPVVSYISKTHNIDINILEANIKNTRGGSVGFIVVHIPHIAETEFETFKEDLHQQHVNVEVVKHG